MKRTAILVLIMWTWNTATAQFTEVFWESRNINDSLAEDTRNGLGQWVKLPGDSFVLRLIDDMVKWHENYMPVKEYPEVSIDSIKPGSIVEVNVDSLGLYDLDNFMSVKGKIKRSRFDWYFEGELINYVAKYRVEKYPDDASTEYIEKHIAYVKAIPQSVYSKKMHLKLHPVNYIFSKKNEAINNIAFCRMMLRWENTLYTVYIPYEAKH
jgi:hypothetical protein